MALVSKIPQISWINSSVKLNSGQSASKTMMPRVLFMTSTTFSWDFLKSSVPRLSLRCDSNDRIYRQIKTISVIKVLVVSTANLFEFLLGSLLHQQSPQWSNTFVKVAGCPRKVVNLKLGIWKKINYNFYERQYNHNDRDTCLVWNYNLWIVTDSCLAFWTAQWPATLPASVM